MKLLDTSVAVDHLRGHTAATELIADLLETGEELLSSELVRFELFAGVRPREVAALETFFRAIVWLPVTEDVAREAGTLARKYRRSHTNIDDVDYLIASTALIVGCDVLTTNVRHFPMLPRLQAPY
ncbi:MAG: type II toxin-antitoxin system VapC family toxin [Actinomycetota bacterium]